jgi:hypothetical protein
MILSSAAFGKMASSLISAAESLCGGRVLFAHEGGYSKDYVPFCGLAVMEALTGVKSIVEDPNIDEVSNWGYQELQAHQARVVNSVVCTHGLAENSLSTEESEIVTAMNELLMQLPEDKQRAAVEAIFCQAFSPK